MEHPRSYAAKTLHGDLSDPRSGAARAPRRSRRRYVAAPAGGCVAMGHLIRGCIAVRTCGLPDAETEPRRLLVPRAPVFAGRHACALAPHPTRRTSGAALARGSSMVHVGLVCRIGGARVFASYCVLSERHPPPHPTHRTASLASRSVRGFCICERALPALGQYGFL